MGFGSNAGKGVRVYAVDRHTEGTFPDFERHIEEASIAKLITPIKGRSQEAAADFDEAIELLFIDGAHQYELVREDFDRWVREVVEGGVVAMHDSTWFEGPQARGRRAHLQVAALQEHAATSSARRPSPGKVAENTALDRLRNRYGLAVKRSVELTRRLAEKDRIPQPLQRAGRRILRALQ